MAGGLPIWGSAPIPSERDRRVGEDGLNFWGVIRLFLRSWPWIKPQVIDREPIRFVIGGRHLALPRPGHLLWYFLVRWLNQMLYLVTGAWTLDILNQVLLQGKPLTELQAWLLRLDIPAFVGVEALSRDQRLEVMWLYVIVTVFLWFVHQPINLFLVYYDVWIMQRVNQDLRMDLVDRWHQLSLRYHHDARVGDSIYRMYQDSAMVVSVVNRVITVLSLLASVVTCVFLVSFFDPILAGLCVLAFIPALGWGRWFSPRMRAFARASRENTAALTARIQETFAGIRVIKEAGAEEREQRRFESDSVIAFNSAYRIRSLVAIITIVVFTITALVLISAEFMMALWARLGRPTAGSEIIAFFGVSFVVWNLGSFRWANAQLFDAATDVRGLTRQWAGAQDIAIGLDRVFDILDIEPDVTDRPGAVALSAVREGIRFDRASFAYQSGQPTIAEVSFTARPGTVNAIVGPTGAGKSTLMVLLLRLFDLDSGRILIDDRELTGYQVESVRDAIAIALQENILFNMSVRDNIRFAVPDADADAVEAAARTACAHEFIESLPDSYDTMLGERAVKLSSGQRQRLSIARALLKDTPVLILDEPTAALDAETEQQVLANLALWGRGRIIFLITHRLSTIRAADQILYLEAGRVAEIGTHDELMARAGGSYSAFARLEEAMAVES